MARIEIYKAEDSELFLPLAEGVKAGFPSPAEDIPHMSLDITSQIVKNPASTFYARVSGTSMIDDGIGDGDILVVDKSVTPYNGCIAICFVDGEFTLKHLHFREGGLTLCPANKNYPEIEVCEGVDFVMWGVVTYVIKKVR